MSIFKKNLLLVLGSTIFAVIIFIVGYEIVARIIYYKWREEFAAMLSTDKVTKPSPYEKLMWEYKPYGVLYSPLGDIHVNRYGYRDFDYPTRKRPKEVYRIAFAGDSVTLGLAVENDDAIFVRKYNVFVNQKYPNLKVQAMNFSADGYNTLNILEMIKTRILTFDPNKVVYFLCLNDFVLDGASGLKTEYFDPPKSFFLKKLDEFRFKYSGVEYHQYNYNKNREIVFDAILEMRDALKKAKVGFGVAIMPLSPDLFYQNRSVDCDMIGVHREIGAFLKQNEIERYDLLSTFQKHLRPPTFFPGDVWHPNIEGHRLIAESLAASIPLN